MEKDSKKIISLKYDEVYREVFAHESVRKQFLSDVMGIPPESIRTARLVTPHLWRRYRSQKLGILDFRLLEGENYHSVYRLFNAKSEEELDMLAAKNKGLAEAAEVIKRMSLGKTLQYWYEARLKAIRDRYGEDEYIRDLGRTEGKTEDVLELLGEKGELPNALRERIQTETDLQVLSKWLKAAAKAESISEFEKLMN